MSIGHVVLWAAQCFSLQEPQDGVISDAYQHLDHYELSLNLIHSGEAPTLCRGV